MLSLRGFLLLFIKKFFLSIFLIFTVLFGALFIQTIGYNAYWCSDNTHGPLLTWSNLSGSSYLNTSSTITISWESNEEVDSVVEYGTDPSVLEHKIVNLTLTRFHFVELTDLLPGTRYYYRVLTSKGDFDKISDVYSFVTPSYDNLSRVHFGIYGDTRDSINALQAVSNALYAMNELDPYNFIVHVGDIVDSGGKRATWNQFFKRVQALHASVPLLPVIGNHEFKKEGEEEYSDADFPDLNESLAEHYLKYFALPGNEKYYALDIGNVHFIVLDSNNPGGTFYRDTDEDKNAQAQWLYDDLRIHNLTAGWIFVAFHHPFIEDILYNISTSDGPRSMTISQIFHEGGVDGIFVGHVHTYERQWHNGSGTTIPYVITGGGGASIGKGIHWENISVVAVPRTYHFMDLSVIGGDLNVTVYDIHGNIIDSFYARNYKWEVDV